MSSWAWGFSWIILPVLIFVARVLDVSIGTVRLIFVSRGIRVWAAVCGFFEVIIWLLAISQIMESFHDLSWYIIMLYYTAYGGGFAMGTYVGIRIEEKLSIGVVSIRIITQERASELIQLLRSKGYGVTAIDAEGKSGPVKVIYTIVRRKHIPEVIENIQRLNPKAFYTIEDVRAVAEGVFPKALPSRFGFARKGK